MRCLATILITLLLALPALSVELFRYRGAANDGGTLEYIFEAVEQNSPNAVSKEKAAEIAADFMTTFYHVQIGALETQDADNARSVLADLLLGHDQRIVAPNVLRRFACPTGRLLSREWRNGCRRWSGHRRCG
jgi:hypothetical protein